MSVTEEVQRYQRSMRREVLSATGVWIGEKAEWTHFVTLTHRAPTDVRPVDVPGPRKGFDGTWTRVGMSRHRKLVRRLFYDVIRPRDPGARWWSETEFHATGVPHEHALLALSTANVALLSIRQEWYEQCGYIKILPVYAGGQTAAEYVAKYTEKGGSYPPLILGFGLHDAPTFSMVLPEQLEG